MSSLIVSYHAKAIEEFERLVDSDDENEQIAAAQLLSLIDLIEASPSIRDRILGQHDVVSVSNADGSYFQVDIKLILELKEIANDPKYCTDAVRRIRDLINKPADNYRVFFAPRPNKGSSFRFDVLGVFHRNVAYLPSTLNELKRRYESQ